jgi:hypothetical protein
VSTDTHVPVIPDSQVLIEDYEAQRRFRFNGALFLPGDKISVEVYRHRRFDTLVSTGYIRLVK